MAVNRGRRHRLQRVRRYLTLKRRYRHVKGAVSDRWHDHYAVMGWSAGHEMALWMDKD